MVQLAGMDAGAGAPGYERHRPEKTLLYQIVKEHYPAFVTRLTAEGKVLPDYVHQEFEEFLKCGLLEHGFLRVQCDSCHAEQLVAFSCKRRGFCRGRLRFSCGARRMAESAALLVDEAERRPVLPHRPMRQWVLSVPHPLRFLFASQPKIMGKVLGIVYRTLATHLIQKAGYKKSQAHTGAVTLIQRCTASGGFVKLIRTEQLAIAVELVASERSAAGHRLACRGLWCAKTQR